MTKILVIEDEEFIRENLIELLEDESFEVTSADNGKVGVELARKHLPDLILCDVMMPELNGYDVLKTLRSLPETEMIPFIFLTAKADKVDFRTAMLIGADDYLTKPCTQDELIAAIATRLEKKAAIDRISQEKVDELRNSILHSLPHELRTPLTGIMGFSEFLINECDDLEPSEIKEMGSCIYRSSQRLHRLIQNFLLYADLELLATNAEQVKALRSHRIEYSQRPIAEASQKIAAAANREMDLQLDLQESSAKISEIKLRKVIEELVENAFKFSEPGTPVRIVSRQETNKFTLAIVDRGRGMTGEQLANVGAYMQFERKLYEQQGSGLGLTIAKRMVELHAGELIVESIPNRETTVRLVLPA